MDADELRAVLRAFEDAGVDYVLIGAAAMGFHGMVRATEDVDVVVRAAAENIDRIRNALRSVYAGDPTVDEIRTDDLLGDYPAVRYVPPAGDLYFDLMTRLGEMADFNSIEAGIKETGGVRVRVATPAARGTVCGATSRSSDSTAANRSPTRSSSTASSRSASACT